MNKTDIVNSLTSTDSTKILSAAQGKVLNDAVSVIGDMVSSNKSKAVSANTATEITSIDLTPGRWVVMSYMDLSVSISDVYNHMLGSRTVRSYGKNGGGSTNCNVYTITQNTTFAVTAYVPSACTVNVYVNAVRIL